MMAGFKRAQLNGSEELFRATGQQSDDTARTGASSEELLLGTSSEGPAANSSNGTDPVKTGVLASKDRDAASQAGPHPGKGHLHPEGGVHQTRAPLTPAEIDILARLIQGAKFPSNPVQKPPLEEFEQLELLRKKLLSLKQ